MQKKKLRDLVKIQEIQYSDIKELFILYNDETTRKNSFSSEKIDFEEHEKWFSEKLNDKNCLFLGVKYNNELVGMIRFDILNDEVLINVNVNKEYRGHGIAEKMVNDGILIFSNKYKRKYKIIAQIKEKNISSKKVFKKCNFVLRNIVYKNKIKAEEYVYML